MIAAPTGGILDDLGRFSVALVGLALVGGFGYWFLSTKLEEDAYRSHFWHERTQRSSTRRAISRQSRSRARSLVE